MTTMTVTAAEITDARLDVIAHAREVLERARSEHGAWTGGRVRLFRVHAAMAPSGALSARLTAPAEKTQWTRPSGIAGQCGGAGRGCHQGRHGAGSRRVRERRRGGAVSNDSDSYTYPPTGEELTRVTTVLDGTEGKRVSSSRGQPSSPPSAPSMTSSTSCRLLQAEGREAAVDYLKTTAAEQRDLKADVGSYVHAYVEALILWQASPDGHGGGPGPAGAAGAPGGPGLRRTCPSRTSPM